MNLSADDRFIIKYFNGGMDNATIAKKLSMTEEAVANRISELLRMAASERNNQWDSLIAHQRVTMSQLALLEQSIQHTNAQLERTATPEDLVGCSGVSLEGAHRILERFIVLLPFEKKLVEEMDTEIDEK